MPPRLFRVPPLLSVLEAVLESLQQNFLGVCALSSLCAAAFFFFFYAQKRKEKKIGREIEKVTTRTVSVLDADMYACARECVYVKNCSFMCVCARAWFPNAEVAS